MAKRKKPQKTATPQRPSADEQTSSDATTSQEDASVSNTVDRRLSLGAQRAYSVLILAHFFAVITALSANFAPSYVQGIVMDYLSPYLVSVHQSYGALPLELTHGDAVDFPVQVVGIRGADGEPEEIEFRSSRGGDLAATRWPNFARIYSVIAEENPESEILAEIAAQAVRRDDKLKSDRVNGLSVVSFAHPHVLSFDEDSLIHSGGEVFIDGDMGDESVFQAAVVRTADGDVGLLPAQDDSRTSRSTSLSGDGP